jgi:hypothetical protein
VGDFDTLCLCPVHVAEAPSAFARFCILEKGGSNLKCSNIFLFYVSSLVHKSGHGLLLIQTLLGQFLSQTTCKPLAIGLAMEVELTNFQAAVMLSGLSEHKIVQTLFE